MSGLSKLGEALTVVFVVSLLALLSELLYILWRRRLFLRQDTSEIRPDHHPELTAKDGLLYFFCLKSTHSQVEAAVAAQARGSDGSPVDDPTEVIDGLKLREMYGPSRVLVTIKEEREDLESEKSLSSATNGARTRSLSKSFEDTGVSPESVVTIDEEDIEVTPFSTPCASPLYFTPTGSPVYEILGREICNDKTAS